MSPQESAVRPAGRGWNMVFPPGWATIPTAPDLAPAAVRRVLDRVFAGKSRDELAKRRIELDQRLRALAETAHGHGASHLHLLAEPIRGVPVSASLTVSHVDGTLDGDLDAALRDVFGASNGIVELDRGEVGEFTGLRRRRRILEPTSGPEPAVHHCLDYIIDTGGGALVLLAFTTDTDPVADAMMDVFDMMARTLRRA